MRFLNRYIFGFIAILASTAIAFYLVLQYFLETRQYNYISLLSIAYMLIIFFAAFLISKKDIYEGYYGFNYHLFTYVICNAVPLLLVKANVIDTTFEAGTYKVMLTWGIGLFVHSIVYFVLRRKRSLKGFDKREIFD